MSNLLTTLESALKFMRERGGLPMALSFMVTGTALVERGNALNSSGENMTTGLSHYCPHLCGATSAENYVNFGIYIVMSAAIFFVSRMMAATIVNMVRVFRPREDESGGGS